MKKIALALIAVLGVMLGSGLSASAADGYPPGTTITITAPTATSPVAPGASFPISVNHVTPGTVVKVTFNGTTYTATAGSNGVATVTVTAPATAGSYPISVVAGTTPVAGSAAVGVLTTTTTVAATTTTVKPTNTVPATGSNAPFAGVAIGLPLLVGGLALLILSRRRPVGA